MDKNLKNNLIKLNKFFLDMTILSKEQGFFRFAYQSRAHWMIICLIGSKHDFGISFEEICSSIDSRLTSRSTIQNILDNGHSINFFIKNKSEKDKRIQLYYLSENSLKEVIGWINRQEEIFS
tara:strand:- start:191 stop:556 length:366 start_codon:yes stop_codon:yes gene_type:complete